jgi:hypothetical protein
VVRFFGNVMIDTNIRNTIEQNLPEIENRLNQNFNLFKQSLGRGYDKLSTKLKSELLSNMVESTFEDTISGVIAPTKDSEADVIIDTKPLEIKTTATTDSWRGGEFSKRPGDYLMVGWEEVEGELRLFMLLTYLTEQDWISSGSDNYYATSISLTKIVESLPHHIIKGSVLKKRIKTHMVKI